MPILKTITLYDKEYPALLKEIANPPPILYLRGNAELLKTKCFAVVGTRRVGLYGRKVTPLMAGDLARAGLTIVSGMALGVDSLAHEAAMNAGGKTIAVLGSSLDDKSVFPPKNLGLLNRILESGGLAISEYPVPTRAQRFTFRNRNRIISGLCLGTLVVEAPFRSGALITAYSAMEQNRDLFAVPGPVLSKNSQGTNLLIRKGAFAATCAQDILSELGLDAQIASGPENAEEEKIIEAIKEDYDSMDKIAEYTGLEISRVGAVLTTMELDGKIKRINGRYVL